jgi:hypothetical protein
MRFDDAVEASVAAALAAAEEAAAQARIDDRIRELNAQGWSDRMIGDELGMTQTRVNRRRRRLELPTVGKPGPKQKEAA